MTAKASINHDRSIAKISKCTKAGQYAADVHSVIPAGSSEQLACLQ